MSVQLIVTREISFLRSLGSYYFYKESTNTHTTEMLSCSSMTDESRIYCVKQKPHYKNIPPVYVGDQVWTHLDYAKSYALYNNGIVYMLDIDKKLFAEMFRAKLIPGTSIRKLERINNLVPFKIALKSI